MSRSAESHRRGALLLAGMMGSGKTTVGRLLARRFGWAFLDTDACIEEKRGLPVHEIFARDGEPRFREAERAVLEELPDRGAVIALGGGALVAPENRIVARRKGTLVWLAAEAETLAERIGSAQSRPLLAGLDAQARVARLRSLCAEREQAYASTDFRVSTDGRTPEQVCEAVLGALGWETSPR